MRIPKYIDDALRKRTKAAQAFNKYDWIVSHWLDDHGIGDEIDTANTHGGVESIVNPTVAERIIRNAIYFKEG